MFQYCGKPIVEYWKLRGIAKKIRSGTVPAGCSKERAWEALCITKPKNGMEVFGLLTAKLQRATGETVFEDRLMSVNKVTTGFAIRLVDMLIDNSVTMGFNFHKQGSGSTAEATADSALVTAQSGSQTGAASACNTHGASSNIFQSVGTITAATTYEIREHGLFNASTGGVLLDRSVVTGISVNTDDIVTWTYNLTVTPGG